MRFFKLNRQFNWKYVLGEIALIFIGINLAIWFNDWNASKKSAQNKRIAISKIKDEIKNNQGELSLAQTGNQLIIDAFNAYKAIYFGNTSKTIATPAKMKSLGKKYPGYFQITDSIKHVEGQYKYSGETHIELELPSLTDIAWQTTKDINVANDFKYNCLYELQSMYNLQKRVQNEVDKAAAALQQRKLNDLMNILSFLQQLNEQLASSYTNMLANIDECN